MEAASGVEGSSVTDAVFGKQGDPNSGLNTAIDYYDQVYGGAPGINGAGMFGGMTAPQLDPITAQQYDPVTIAYGPQPAGYGNNSAISPGRTGLESPGTQIPGRGGQGGLTLGNPRIDRAFGGRDLGMGGARNAGDLDMKRAPPNPNQITLPELQAMQFSAPDALGYGQELTYGGISAPRQISASTIGPAGSVGVERMGAPGSVGVERIGRAGAVPVERVGFGAQHQMIDPRSLGMDTEWRNGFNMDPRTLQAQNSALDHFNTVMEGDGFDPVSEAAYQRRVAEAEVRRRGQGLAVMREQELQGLGGSGMDVMAQLMTGQAATSDQYLAALDAAAMQQTRMDTAGMNMGQLGGQMRAQEFGEHAQRAGAMDAWNQFMGGAILNSSEVNSGRALQTALQNQQAQNAGYSQQYGLQGQFSMANADAQNRAFSQQYGAGVDVAMANARAQNDAYSQQYGLQGQYNLANASNRLSADQFNVGNEMTQSQFNANARNQAASANFDRRGSVDMFNAGNAFTGAMANWQNQSDVAKTNNQNAYNAGIFSANARNAASQNNANARSAADIYNSGLQQQTFNNDMGIREQRAREVRDYAGMLSGRQEGNTPGLVDYVGAAADVVSGVYGIFNPAVGAARSVAGR